MSTSDYADTLDQERAEKDQFFGEHPHSPIPDDRKAEFDGLRYFDTDPAYRFEASVHEHDEKEEVTVETTADGEQTYLRWGEFHLDVGGDEVVLQAYRRPGDEEEGYWVPFRDETSGEETYGAGRYIDLDGNDETADGDWVVDFNRAYNPFCAYNEAYECPLIPMENWLDVRIEAGELTYE